MEFAKYEPVPRNVQEEMVKAYKRKSAAAREQVISG